MRLVRIYVVEGKPYDIAYSRTNAATFGAAATVAAAIIIYHSKRELQRHVLQHRTTRIYLFVAIATFSAIDRENREVTIVKLW